MKIGIVTYYNVPSYGAVLQAFALQKVLEGLGHEVLLLDIDYLRLADGGMSLRRFIAFSIHGTIEKWSAEYQKFFLRRGMFRVNRLKQTKRAYASYADIHHDCPDVDCCIVGSDQIWSPKLFMGQREVEKLRTVLLDFARGGVRRVAYAVSFGSPVWDRTDLSDELEKGFCTFHGIGVREVSGLEIVRRYGGKDPVWVLDPTLLHLAQFYRDELGISDSSKGGYLFQYILFPQRRIQGVVCQIAKSSGINEVRDHWVHSSWRRVFLRCPAGVEQWVGLIAGSERVVTDSYHAVVFSLVFHRPFHVLVQVGGAVARNDRICSLLSRLGLENRILDPESGPVVDDSIDWEQVDCRLEAWRRDSMAFLEKVTGAYF